MKPLHHIEATIMGSHSVKVREVLLAAAARASSVNFQFYHGSAKSGKPQLGQAWGGGSQCATH